MHEAFKWLWKARSIPKLKVFGWFLLSERLNTRNMLKRRHYNIGNNFDCLLCGQHTEETAEHLFFRCAFSVTCWNELNISWPAHGNRLETILHLKTLRQRAMIMDIFLVVTWSLWKERNNNYFCQVAPSVSLWRARFKKDVDNIRHRVLHHKKQIVALIADSIS